MSGVTNVIDGVLQSPALLVLHVSVTCTWCDAVPILFM